MIAARDKALTGGTTAGDEAHATSGGGAHGKVRGTPNARVARRGRAATRRHGMPRGDGRIAAGARMARLTIAQAHALVSDALVRCDTSRGNADAVARALVRAEAVGLKGHGLTRVPSYAAQSRSGKVSGHAVPTHARPRPGLLSVDAAHGFAYPALDLAVSLLPAIAREQGVATAGIRRSHHCGAAGFPVEALARAGLAALLMANSPAAMAPWGGRKATFGTNPIAFAFPRRDRTPVVVDLSLSKVARGNIVAAKQRGTPIPEGWAMDADGRPTTDPDAALAGTMVPLGDAKGTALALMVEILAAGLTGANFAADASSYLDTQGGPPGTGQVILAFDPDAFGPGGVRRFEALAASVEEQPGTRLPGSRRDALLGGAVAKGIAVDDAVVAGIEAL